MSLKAVSLYVTELELISEFTVVAKPAPIDQNFLSTFLSLIGLHSHIVLFNISFQINLSDSICCIINLFIIQRSIDYQLNNFW